MIAIFGLGNPGKRYQETRHNIGFRVLKELAGRWRIELKQKSFHALWGCGKVEEQKIFLAMPQTYMNLSGVAVRELTDYFKVKVHDVIVVHDDLDLSFGRIRLKSGGGDAGHKGLKSVTECLGTTEFNRIRIGIGKPQDKSRIEDYVLEKFNREEASLLDDIIRCAAEATEEVVVSGLQQAMAKYHAKNISTKKEDC
jgi:PTH1 family peptidyl-tRNA hydrolase